jgi:hypothetical protein
MCDKKAARKRVLGQRNKRLPACEKETDHVDRKQVCKGVLACQRLKAPVKRRPVRRKDGKRAQSSCTCVMKTQYEKKRRQVVREEDWLCKQGD